MLLFRRHAERRVPHMFCFVMLAFLQFLIIECVPFWPHRLSSSSEISQHTHVGGVGPEQWRSLCLSSAELRVPGRLPWVSLAPTAVQMIRRTCSGTLPATTGESI
eukprot:5502216-Prymnesium_polylepis.1